MNNLFLNLIDLIAITRKKVKESDLIPKGFRTYCDPNNGWRPIRR